MHVFSPANRTNHCSEQAETDLSHGQPVCSWQMKQKRPFSLKFIQPNSEIRAIMLFAPGGDVLGVDTAFAFFPLK